MEEPVSGTANLQKRCAELEAQLAYYKAIANDTGKKRLREVEQLNHLIAKSRSAEHEKQLGYERLLTILESVDAGIYVADLETNEILFMNKKMAQAFGHDALGKPCWKVFYNAPKPCDDCINKRLVDENGEPTGLRSWQGENPLTGKHYVYYDRVIPWTDGRMAKIQSATDISQLKSMEKQLQQKYKMEAIGTMAGGIAHDFNNILAIIMTNLELMHRMVEDGNPLLPRIENAKSASLRASELVKQILSYSRHSEQKLIPLQLSAGVEASCKLMRSTIPASIEMSIQIEDEARSAMIKADSTQIDEVLINLCNNAAYAMGEKGLLTVALTRESLKEGTFPMQPRGMTEEWLKLSISDTGPGIQQKILEKIFDPFYTTKPIGEGTGMGLSICYGIAKHHNGFIVVDSLLGQGTHFSVYFPVVEAKELQKKEKQVKTSPRGHEKILLVDDEKLLAQSISEYLGAHGYSVTVENNSLRALELFKKNPAMFDFVISDQTMPELTGIEFASELLKVQSDLPIVLCSGYSASASKQKAKEMGIKAFLMKPLAPQRLLEKIRTILDENACL
ncbi:PAS domain-containing protein [Desulfuromusa kysingii]|uniref:histidine kinase n=1 Tax=Desulfuromusa kysingii TaxID=37625 RepID=A0A1H3ZS16_9BACT|nr:response regulator [Desulfuromusa kysingii]SEA26062.1 PAS domain-containing protein [Desulfuromusa kysingii]